MQKESSLIEEDDAQHEEMEKLHMQAQGILADKKIIIISHHGSEQDDRSHDAVNTVEQRRTYPTAVTDARN